MSKQNESIKIPKSDYGFLAFVPLIIFLVLYLGGGIIFTILGTESPFSQIPRHAALLIGVIVAFFMKVLRKTLHPHFPFCS